MPGTSSIRLYQEDSTMKVVTYNIRGDFGVDGKNDFCFR